MKFKQLFLASVVSVMAAGGFAGQVWATDSEYDRASLTPAQIAEMEMSDEEMMAEAEKQTQAFMEEYYGSKDGPLAEQYAKQELLEASRKKVAAYNMTWQERKKQIEDEKLLKQQKQQEKEQAVKGDERLVAPRQVYRPADRRQDSTPPRLFNNVQ